MGAHANYYLIIEHLIILKGEFYRITKDRFQPVIRELSNYEVYPNSDNEHLPDHKTLATKLKYSQSAMNSILRDLLKELVLDFYYPPLKVTKHVHQILIHIPWDEEHEFKNKDYLKQVQKESLWVPMVLPVTPRIGEEIEIPFVEGIGKLYRGYVHQIRHRITGDTQEILIDVHPWNDFYHKWVKMKNEFERRKSWKES
jgi:hypothetical protein